MIAFKTKKNSSVLPTNWSCEKNIKCRIMFTLDTWVVAKND